MNLVTRKLEEKERLLQNTLSAVEKELVLRQQAMEMHKRKAIESAQSAADLKLHLGMFSFTLINRICNILDSMCILCDCRKIPCSNERSSTSSSRKNECIRSRGLQDQKITCKLIVFVYFIYVMYIICIILMFLCV